ncbi:hypothetical protein FGO68_gene13448 [Halteria grandinella]|uniref:Uncharacterized protein n=1 Tax=Halteria grandinella TaxID=5974 RepID=A0A8J8ND81_HALGN|nr:hypothetical protein FGO68_gene13448 [Halteria grandinella]
MIYKYFLVIIIKLMNYALRNSLTADPNAGLALNQGSDGNTSQISMRPSSPLDISQDFGEEQENKYLKRELSIQKQYELLRVADSLPLEDPHEHSECEQEQLPGAGVAGKDEKSSVSRHNASDSTLDQSKSLGNKGGDKVSTTKALQYDVDKW